MDSIYLVSVLVICFNEFELYLFFFLLLVYWRKKEGGRGVKDVIGIDFFDKFWFKELRGKI